MLNFPALFIEYTRIKIWIAERVMWNCRMQILD